MYDVGVKNLTFPKVKIEIVKQPIHKQLLMRTYCIIPDHTYLRGDPKLILW